MTRRLLKLMGALAISGTVVAAPSELRAAPPANSAQTAKPNSYKVRQHLLRSRERVAQATVTLPEKGCAGSVVWQSDRVLTAAHCVPEGADRQQVTLRDGRTIEGRLEYLDRGADLALLHLDESTFLEPLTVGTDLPNPTNYVLFVGRIDRPSKTQVARVERLGRCPSLPDVPDAVFTNIVAYPGDSGSPILDRDLRVVGVIHGGASCHIAAPTAELGVKIESNLLGSTGAAAIAPEPTSGTGPAAPPEKTYRIGPFLVESLPNGFRLNWSFKWSAASP